MTPMGFLVLMVCFVGPVMPPLIGMAVGALHDAVTRPGESLDARTRLRISQRSTEAA